jgi:DMSO/TMAO reductase YedYZ molybdopterin-dependent catalytic subunit
MLPATNVVEMPLRLLPLRRRLLHYGSIDMPSALHPQTILALDFLGAPLTAPFGAPVNLRIPTKLGFKNPKSIVAIGVTNAYPGGYWEDQGYNWFSGS